MDFVLRIVEARVFVLVNSSLPPPFSTSPSPPAPSPSPSFLANVSGNANTIKTTVTPPYPTKNHCVLLHPSPSPIAPPTIGASNGPHNGPR